MTREEAIEELKRDIHNAKVTHHLSEHYEMAIKALEQEPCEDAVSRKALIERINKAEENFKFDHIESISSDIEDPYVDGVLSGVFNIRQMVAQAPPVTPTQSWIPVPEGATNGDMFKTMFPNVSFGEFMDGIMILNNNECEFWHNWWDAPYKGVE